LLGEICALQAPRLLAWPDGERRLSNYLQLAEDLQGADAARHGPAALLAELEQRIADADSANDAELLRLESDAARVRIMTLHVSKGLTLDLVFLPYCAMAGGNGHATQPPMARVHEGLARIGELFPDKQGTACQQETKEMRAEQVRLLYVGLTRARLATWIGWGPSKDAHRSALGGLLHRQVGQGAIPVLDGATVDDALQALRAEAPDAVAVEPPLPADALATLPRLRFDAGAMPPPARPIRRHIDRDWWVYSFSQLAREASGIEARAADDEPEPAPLARSRFSGTRFGNALHDALEHIDFAAWHDHRGDLPPGGQVAPLADALRAAGFASDADQLEGVPVLTSLVSETLNAAMPEGARLATVPPALRLAEMEFHLALAPLRVDALLALLRAHGLVEERLMFGQRQRIEGLLTGRIDLVYEHEGRFYVLDYKSNQLPAYDAATLDRAVRESEYDLQYVLYTLALHRWLRFRLGAAYDIGTHLGGVRYLFSRGLDRDDPARPGVHAVTLDPALVLALDALCRGAP
jgi:exodeoxyribonuclease V beta subunit